MLAFLCAILFEDGMQVVELGGGFPPLLAVILNSIEKVPLLGYEHQQTKLWLGQKRKKWADLITLAQNGLQANPSGFLPSVWLLNTLFVQLWLISRLTYHAAWATANCLLFCRSDLSKGSLLNTSIFLSIAEDLLVLLRDTHVSRLFIFGHHVDSDYVHGLDNVVFNRFLGWLGELTAFHRWSALWNLWEAIHVGLSFQNFVPSIRMLCTHMLIGKLC